MSWLANTQSISTNEYVQDYRISLMKSTRWPPGVGHFGRKTDLEQLQQVHGVSFKKRAPRAIKEIKKFAEKAMVLIDPGPHVVLVDVYIASRTDADSDILQYREPMTSVSTLNSTRKSGNLVSKACHTVYACESRENVTMRRMPRRSCTATSRRSMSRIQRASRLLLSRTRESKWVSEGEKWMF